MGPACPLGGQYLVSFFCVVGRKTLVGFIPTYTYTSFICHFGSINKLISDKLLFNCTLSVPVTHITSLCWIY